MPTVIGHGLDLEDDAFVIAHMVFKIHIRPLIAAAALAATWRNRHLAAATIAAMLPTLVDAAGLAAFAAGVMLYGF
jgi:hypothetical protein